MKTLKVDNEFYDKVKAIADASGDSLVAASNGVVMAGLGELKGLADSLKDNRELKDSKKSKLEAPVNDEDLIITEPYREPKIDKKVKAEVKVVEATDTQERQFFCLECGGEVKVSESRCAACGVALNWNAVEENPGAAVEKSEESEGNGSWIWVAGALMGILALRRRIQRNGVLRIV